MVQRYLVEKRAHRLRPGALPAEDPAGADLHSGSARPRCPRRKYADAWVLMDRIHDAGDSGEILFKHVRAHHPEINAWFVIDKDTADYAPPAQAEGSATGWSPTARRSGGC